MRMRNNLHKLKDIFITEGTLPLTFSNMQTHFEINELEKLAGL